jgi:hypothetical protein
MSTTKGISLPLDSATRCLPSIVFIRNSAALRDFCRTYNALYLIRKLNDMKAFFRYSRRRPQICSYFPVVPASYREGKKELRSISGDTSKKFDYFDKDFGIFNGIFDPGAIGQFLGGVDPRNDPNSTPGYINDSMLYSPRDFGYSWKDDGQGRLVPICSYSGLEFPLFNLHVHSKALHKFRSDRQH